VTVSDDNDHFSKPVNGDREVMRSEELQPLNLQNSLQF